MIIQVSDHNNCQKKSNEIQAKHGVEAFVVYRIFQNTVEERRLAKGSSSILVEEVYHRSCGDILIGQSAMFYDRAELLQALDEVRDAKDKEQVKKILFQNCDAITCSVAFARDKKED